MKESGNEAKKKMLGIYKEDIVLPDSLVLMK